MCVGSMCVLFFYGGVEKRRRTTEALCVSVFFRALRDSGITAHEAEIRS